jgi:hypothetical protein
MFDRLLDFGSGWEPDWSIYAEDGWDESLVGEQSIFLSETVI